MDRNRAQRASMVLSAVLTAMGYFLAASGCLPCPSDWRSLFQLTSAERFPCDGHACGCASALECWTHCCCYSDQERLAWAIRNDVEPPAPVRFTEEQWVAAANSLNPGGAHCMLCVSEMKRAAAVELAARGDPDACCVAPPHASPTSDSCCLPANGARPRTPVASALSCKRISSMIGLALPAILLDRGIAPPSPATCAESCFRPTSQVRPSRTLDVPDPPPRSPRSAS